MSVEVRWTGSYPCLCCGTWILKVNGKNVSEKIPDELRHEPMGTYGTYSYWHFAGWEEKFKEYQDGMKCERWVEANKSWLSAGALRSIWGWSIMSHCKTDRVTALEALRWDCQMFPELKMNQRSTYARMLDLFLQKALKRGWHSGTGK